MTKAAFITGASTEEEVRALMQINIEAGAIVPYERIAKLSGIRYGTSRFWTVVGAWTRRVFREQKMQHATVRRVGVRFLTETQALNKGIHDTQKTATRERQIATRVKTINSVALTAPEQKQHELLGQYLRARDSEARKAKKQIGDPKAIGATIIRLAG